MRVAIATFSAMPPELTDDASVADALTAEGADVVRVPWDDRRTDWRSFDAVVIRSTWDYSARREEFVAWAGAVGPRLHNAARLVRWNSDKGYLADLAAAGVATIPTEYVAPGAALPRTVGEFVVKPTVSAGASDTGRFSPATHDVATDLLARIHGSGRTAMVQPYVPSVDTHGETAVVCLDGRPSHVLRKRAVLRPDEVAPVRDNGVVAAAAMFEPDLVVAGEATDDELRLATEVMAHVVTRFAYVPLYARVDMVAGPGGPVLMELEAVEPNLYLDVAPASVEVLVEAILRRAAGGATG